jgi:hypothetical protein
MVTEWLNIVNKMMKQQNRRNFMMMNNCPAHKKVEN